jgi:hypothetical protein
MSELKAEKTDRRSAGQLATTWYAPAVYSSEWTPEWAVPIDLLQAD